MLRFRHVLSYTAGVCATSSIIIPNASMCTVPQYVALRDFFRGRLGQKSHISGLALHASTAHTSSSKLRGTHKVYPSTLSQYRRNVAKIEADVGFFVDSVLHMVRLVQVLFPRRKPICD